MGITVEYRHLMLQKLQLQCVTIRGQSTLHLVIKAHNDWHNVDWPQIATPVPSFLLFLMRQSQFGCILPGVHDHCLAMYSFILMANKFPLLLNTLI